MPRNMVKPAAIGCVAIFSVGFAMHCQAQMPPGGAATRPQSRTLDQELLDGLHETRPERPLSVPTPPLDHVPETPLIRTAELMRIVEGRLARHDTSPETQAVQRQIVAALAKVLATGAHRPANAGSPSAGFERDAADKGAGGVIPSRETSGSAGRIEKGSSRQTERTNVRDVVSRAWGDLPDKLRDQMQSTLQEQFLPKYERVIEEYYQRLAEEQVTRP